MCMFSAPSMPSAPDNSAAIAAQNAQQAALAQQQADEAAAKEAQRQATITQDRKSIDNQFGQFTPDYYNKVASDYTSYYNPQLDKQDSDGHALGTKNPGEAMVQLAAAARKDPSGQALTGLQNTVRGHLNLNLSLRNAERDIAVGNAAGAMAPADLAGSLDAANKLLADGSPTRRGLEQVMPAEDLAALDLYRKRPACAPTCSGSRQPGGRPMRRRRPWPIGWPLPNPPNYSQSAQVVGRHSRLVLAVAPHEFYRRLYRYGQNGDLRPPGALPTQPSPWLSDAGHNEPDENHGDFQYQHDVPPQARSWATLETWVSFSRFST